MKLHRHCFLSKKDALNCISNLFNRIVEIRNHDTRAYYDNLAWKHLRFLINLEDRVIDELWREKGD